MIADLGQRNLVSWPCWAVCTPPSNAHILSHFGYIIYWFYTVAQSNGKSLNIIVHVCVLCSHIHKYIDIPVHDIMKTEEHVQ